MKYHVLHTLNAITLTFSFVATLQACGTTAPTGTNPPDASQDSSTSSSDVQVATCNYKDFNGAAVSCAPGQATCPSPDNCNTCTCISNTDGTVSLACTERACTAEQDASADSNSVPDAASPQDAASTCSYANVNDVMVMCGNQYMFCSFFDVPNTPDPLCPSYWQVPSVPNAPKHPDMKDAIAAAGCDSTCVWTFANSATRLYCGHRSGYESLQSQTPGCGVLYRFPEGIYKSVEEHDLANPCP